MTKRSGGVIATRGTAGRTALHLAQQAALSVLGTLAATAILTGLKAEWTVRPSAPVAEPVFAAAPPDLTSGGKFAARLAGGDGPDPFVTLMTLPPLLPMFTAPAVPALDLQPSRIDLADAASADGPSPVVPRPPRLAAPHREPRHLVPTSPALAPSRNAAGTIAMAPLPALTESRSESSSLWSQSAKVYRQMASWSGTLVDHLLP